MAVKDFPFKVKLDPAHLPTWMLIIGYPIFWIEMWGKLSPVGVTSLTAWLLFILFCLYVFTGHVKEYRQKISLIGDYFNKQHFYERILLFIGSFLCLIILLCGFGASLKPPHLSQEYDVLNYHLTIPRQHLILGSFQHIPWSSADLFPLPIDFALAPFWLSTSLPNKFSQFIFFIGLLMMAWRLSLTFFPDRFLAAILVVWAILGSHGFGIQLGTGMLDLVLAYLLLASLESFLKKNHWLSIVEFTFYFWSKSFIPFQTIFLAFLLIGIVIILKKLGFYVFLAYPQEKKEVWRQDIIKIKGRLFLFFTVFSLLIGGPFVLKSLFYAQTPLYPFAPGIMPHSLNPGIHPESVKWKSIRASSYAHLSTKDQYGHGRSLSSFIKHFWLIAVPEKGVNNTFDYPLGLITLLLVGPFIYYFIKGALKKELSLIGIFIIIYWLSWWFGSQQARFLYIPVLFIIITSINYLEPPSKILLTIFILALGLNFISILRAHKNDLLTSDAKLILRERDREVLKLNEEYFAQKRKGYVYLDFHDAPYAQFPFMVSKEKLPFVISYR